MNAECRVRVTENMALNYPKTHFACAACFVKKDLSKNHDSSQNSVWKVKVLCKKLWNRPQMSEVRTNPHSKVLHPDYLMDGNHTDRCF